MARFFPQAKPHRGDVYTSTLIGGSIPLGRLIMKEQNEWFKDSYFGLWEETIRACIS